MDISPPTWSDDAELPTSAPRAHLVAVRFGEYLRDCALISDEQWLAALASHWSEEPRRRIGEIVVAHGYLPSETVERAANQFHDGLDVVEVGGDPFFDPGLQTDRQPSAF